MIIDSGFTAKSGQGTPMYSRRGKSTINNYLCFTKNPEEIQSQRHLLVRNREKRMAQEERGTTKTSVEQLAEKILYVEVEKKRLGDELKAKQGQQQAQDYVNTINQMNASNGFNKNSINGQENSQLYPSEKNQLSLQLGKQGSYAFQASGREKISYHSKISSSGPPIGHYNPQFKQIEFQTQKYSINPENYGIMPRKKHKPKKQCIDNKECTLEKRMMITLKLQQKKGTSSLTYKQRMENLKQIQKSSIDSSIIHELENGADLNNQQKSIQMRPQTSTANHISRQIKARNRNKSMDDEISILLNQQSQKNDSYMNTKKNLINNRMKSEVENNQQMVQNSQVRLMTPITRKTRSRMQSAKNSTSFSVAGGVISPDAQKSYQKLVMNDIRQSAFNQYDKNSSAINFNSSTQGSPSNKQQLKRYMSNYTDVAMININSTVASSFKNIPQSEWSKESPKKTLLNQIKQTFYNCGDYNPNFSNVHSKLDVGHVQFGKHIGRHQVYHERKRSANQQQMPSYMADTHKCYDLLGHVKNNDKTVGFDRVKARDNAMSWQKHISSYNKFNLIKSERNRDLKSQQTIRGF
eukprot:403374475